MHVYRIEDWEHERGSCLRCDPTIQAIPLVGRTGATPMMTTTLLALSLLTASPAVESARAEVKAAQAKLKTAREADKAQRTAERLTKADARIAKAQEAKAKLTATAAR